MLSDLTIFNPVNIEIDGLSAKYDGLIAQGIRETHGIMPVYNQAGEALYVQACSYVLVDDDGRFAGLRTTTRVP